MLHLHSKEIVYQYYKIYILYPSEGNVSLHCSFHYAHTLIPENINMIIAASMQ